MSESKPEPGAEEQTTILHLGKFAPPKPDSASTAPVDESPTLVIRKAAEKTADESPQPVVTSARSALPAKQMLGAIAYCYAKGVYRSEDIERKMLKDPELRAAVGDEVPDAKAIRRFRRHNRQAILTTLGKFFRWRRTKPATGSPSDAASENTQFFMKTEASDTLEKAAWVDNMAKDD